VRPVDRENGALDVDPDDPDIYPLRFFLARFLWGAGVLSIRRRTMRGSRPDSESGRSSRLRFFPAIVFQIAFAQLKVLPHLGEVRFPQGLAHDFHPNAGRHLQGRTPNGSAFDQRIGARRRPCEHRRRLLRHLETWHQRRVPPRRSRASVALSQRVRLSL